MDKRNCILITCDALRKDIFNNLINAGELKNLSRYKEDFTAFDNFYANGPNTYHAMPSLFASKYSAVNGIGIREYERTLPYYFKKEGYTTIGINQGNPWCGRFQGFQNNFDLFLDFMDNAFSEAYISPKEIKSKNKVKQLLKTILSNPVKHKINKIMMKIKILLKDPRRSDQIYERLIKLKKIFTKSLYEIIAVIPEVQPFFLWVHIMDTHSPYIAEYHSDRSFCISANADLIKSSRYKSKGMQLYVSAIKDADESIGFIIDALKEKSVYEKTDIFITTDHGEEFYDHGEFGHSHYQCYEEVLSIPLMIKSPINDIFNDHKESVFSQVDILPTIIAMFDLSKGKDDYFSGSDILSLDTTERKIRPVLSTSFSGENEEDITKICKVIKKDNIKLKYCESINIKELYDLERDPHENINQYKNKPDIVDALRKEFENEIQRAAYLNQKKVVVHKVSKAFNKMN